MMLLQSAKSQQAAKGNLEDTLCKRRVLMCFAIFLYVNAEPAKRAIQ